MKQKKDVRITLRLTPEQYESIAARADMAQMAVGTYVRAAAMRHRVAVVNGLPEITRELKGIGRNLNQLTVLANMDRVEEVNLGEATAALAALYNSVQALAQQEER
jgi:Bacterial mobilisation protein (MobC).